MKTQAPTFPRNMGWTWLLEAPQKTGPGAWQAPYGPNPLAKRAAAILHYQNGTWTWQESPLSFKSNHPRHIERQRFHDIRNFFKDRELCIWMDTVEKLGVTFQDESSYQVISSQTAWVCRLILTEDQHLHFMADVNFAIFHVKDFQHRIYGTMVRAEALDSKMQTYQFPVTIYEWVIPIQFLILYAQNFQDTVHEVRSSRYFRQAIACPINMARTATTYQVTIDPIIKKQFCMELEGIPETAWDDFGNRAIIYPKDLAA